MTMGNRTMKNRAMTARHLEQAGSTLILLLFFLLAGAGLLLERAGAHLSAYPRDRATAAALALARDALMGYATGAEISISGTLGSAKRPGDLPCPDMDDDGRGENASGCGNGTGSTGQHLRLGRLPWRDLGLPDLRDGSGERLWYAVSSRFKLRTRNGTVLNTDTPGTITLRDALGQTVLDGAADGAVAVIIAPGPPLTRPTSVSDSTPYRQDRAGGPLDPINYLDLALGEDNANFLDGSSGNGFIAGPVRDTTGATVANDRLAWIAMDELAPRLERRAIAEVARCLRFYGQQNGDRYPWAAAGSLGSAGSVSYADIAGRRFGRLPDTPFDATHASSLDMNKDLTGDCNINSLSGWWLNWKEVIFYAVADQHKPAPFPPVNRCGVLGFAGSTCLGLDGVADQQFLIIAAGRRLSGQLRTTNAQKNALANYLEGANASDDNVFASASHTGGNDLLKGMP